MLLTTGIVALSRKIADEKAKKREIRQGHMEVGDSLVAKDAFETGINRTGTDIKYEDPTEIAADAVQSPSSSSAEPLSATSTAATSRSPESDFRSPLKSEKGLLDPNSPYEPTPTTPSDGQSVRDSILPPYSPPAAQEPKSPGPPPSSIYSRDTDSRSLSSFDTKSISTQSTNSNGTHALRIKTIGADLRSGFPYHPSLFELKVHPEKWNAFTAQVVESMKFSMKDHAQIWGAATATAMTGAIGTSIFLGRSMTRSTQEKKAKAGLADMDDSGLGGVLKHWNEDYFSGRGLFVHLELSESAMKNPNQKSKAFRKAAWMYSEREDRERKREERKFVIVVTRLDSEGQPTEALEELGIAEKRAAELPSADGLSTTISELPGEGQVVPAELPAAVPPDDEKLLPAELPAATITDFRDIYEPPGGYVEMSSDNTLLLEKMNLERSPEDSPGNDMTPAALSVQAQDQPKPES